MSSLADPRSYFNPRSPGLGADPSANQARSYYNPRWSGGYDPLASLAQQQQGAAQRRQLGLQHLMAMQRLMAQQASGAGHWNALAPPWHFAAPVQNALADFGQWRMPYAFNTPR
jgi:hypothetical protein